MRARAGDAPVYLSFDIDALIRPSRRGPGRRCRGGSQDWQALELVRGLAGLRLVGMDVVEVSPPFDHAEVTALAAATLAHDWLCVLAAEGGAEGQAVGRL